LGKGARNRKKRRDATPPRSRDEALQHVIECLFELNDFDAFAEELAEGPSFNRSDVRQHLETLSRDNGFAPIFAIARDVLRTAETDVARAWEDLLQRRAWYEEVSGRLGTLTNEAQNALASRAFERALSLIEPAVSEARAAGLGLTVAHLESLRAQALVLSSSREREQAVEDAIAALEAARPLALQPAQQHDVLLGLGLAFGERVRGDRAENLDRAVAFLRAALEVLDGTAPAEVVALTKTNLAWALLRIERGDRTAALTEAADLCRAALRYRNSARNAMNWAHTQINLGDVLAQLIPMGLANVAEAERAYSGVIENQQGLEMWMVGAAHFSLGRLYRRRASRSPEQMVEAYANNQDVGDVVDREMLDLSVEHLQHARDLSPTAADSVRRGQILDELSAALSSLDRHAEALLAAEEASHLLLATSDPLGCASVNGLLGALYTLTGRFEEASDAFRKALTAARLTFASRLDTESRERDTRRVGNLFRWAAFAFAKTGALAEAALALEDGRARELTRRISEVSDLDQALDIPKPLRERYQLAAQQLASAPLGPLSAPAARSFQEVITEIRMLPGFDAFAKGATARTLRDALEPEWPLIYVNPTPFGTVLLTVSLGSSDMPVFSADFLEVTSTQLYMVLVAGVEGSESGPVSDPASYLLGIGAGGDADAWSGLDAILPWIGSEIAEPIACAARAANATGSTLIACGPIGFAPLHASPWVAGERTLRLLDLVDVRYAPSAAFTRTALARSERAQSEQQKLVALGDPTNDLPAARPEVEGIAHLLPGESVCAYGSDATSEFLFENAGSADLLHLACHASGGLFDDAETFLVLADGPVTISELTSVHLHTRLVSVSACQSALSNIGRLPEELISIGTALFAIGSACVVASLWPVDDAATALLMIGLYREILDHGLRPPEALRRSQLWLEGLTGAEVSDVLSRYPGLHEEFHRRWNNETTMRSVRQGSVSVRPFAHPYYWAGFTATGA
jgi:tetratricopeptide (TPR) repeat protein